jgi:hypothetical protein
MRQQGARINRKPGALNISLKSIYINAIRFKIKGSFCVKLRDSLHENRRPVMQLLH